MKIKSHITNGINTVKCFFNQLQRPSKHRNTKRLLQRGETLSSFIIREATKEDIPELVMVHVRAWAETYPSVKKIPTFEVREWQWKEQFSKEASGWFCLVAADPNGKLVGFTRGRTYSHSDLPGYDGELNKIYLLKEYQRIGLGTKLICETARRFMHMGISSMILFGEPSNPSIAFHKKMGGEKIYAKNGAFHGAYGWRDLNRLTAHCK